MCLIAALSGLTSPVQAADRSWSLDLQLLSLSVFGNDIRAVTVVDRQFQDGHVSETATGFDLALDSDVTARIRARTDGPRWSWLVTALYFDGPDSNLQLGPRTSDATAGQQTELIAEEMGLALIAPEIGSGTADFNGQGHFYFWHVDAAAVRRWRDDEDVTMGLITGLRVAWYRDAISQNLFELGRGGQGVHHSGGAESDVLAGPALGLEVTSHGRRHQLYASLLQTVVIGTVEFTSSTARVGPERLQQSFTAETTHAIPITELEAGWLYNLGRHFSVGIELLASMWWQLPNAPARAPGENFATDRRSTVTVVGGGIAVRWRSGPR